MRRPVIFASIAGLLACLPLIFSQQANAKPPPHDQTPSADHAPATPAATASKEAPPIPWCDATAPNATCVPKECRPDTRTIFYYHSPACAPCDAMDRIFADPRVRQRLASYVALKVDITAPGGMDLARRVNVRGTPTLDFFGLNCKHAKRIVGAPPSVEEFLRIIDEAEAPPPPPGKPAAK